MRPYSLLTVLAVAAALSACDRKPKAEAATTTDWQVSTDKATWAPVELPSTAWGCNECNRYFRTTVRGVPKSVKFRFASDNKARMMVNGTEAFADFWKEKFCTDKPCCARCCDTGPTCRKFVAEGPVYELSAAALKAFRPGDNEVLWEVHQEGGGSGFHVEMDVGR